MTSLFTNRKWLAAIIGICLLLNIAVATSLRVRNRPLLKERYLLGYGPYRYLRQAKLIVGDGGLPERDMMRYVPLGRDLKQQLSLNSYAIAYFYKFLHLFSTSMTVEQSAIYFPVVCFAFILLAFFLLAAKLLGKYAALLATTLFAAVPGVLSRTSAGFADRDALSLLQILIAFYFYLSAWKATSIRKSIIFSILSGIATGFVGLTWPGVGLPIAIFVGANLTQLLTGKYDWKMAYKYVAWYLPWMVMMFVFTERYIRLFDHLTLLAIGPATLFLLISLLYLTIQRHPKLHRIFTIAHRCPLGLSITVVIFAFTVFILSFVTGPSDLISQIIHSHEYFFYPLGNNRLMRSVSELRPFNLPLWWKEYGLLLPIFLTGFMLALRKVSLHYSFDWRIVASLSGLMLVGTILSNISSTSIFNGHTFPSRFMYLGSVSIFVLGMLTLWIQAHRSQRFKEKDESRFEILALSFLVIWFLITFFGSRSAKRFNMLLTPVAIILSVYAICEGIKLLAAGKQKLQDGLFLCLVSGILSWEIFGLEHNLFSFIINSLSLSKIQMNIHPQLNLNVSLFLLLFFIGAGVVLIQRNIINSGIWHTTAWIAIMLLLAVISCPGGCCPGFVRLCHFHCIVPEAQCGESTKNCDCTYTECGCTTVYCSLGSHWCTEIPGTGNCNVIP